MFGLRRLRFAFRVGGVDTETELLGSGLFDK
jgi:hypothetical protein